MARVDELLHGFNALLSMLCICYIEFIHVEKYGSSHIRRLPDAFLPLNSHLSKSTVITPVTLCVPCEAPK